MRRRSPMVIGTVVVAAPIGLTLFVSAGASLTFAASQSACAQVGVVAPGPSPTPSASQSQGLTVKGAPASAAQIAVAQQLLGVGLADKANATADTAVIYAGIWESGLDPAATNGSYWGVLSGAVGAWRQSDTLGMAHAFFTGGAGFHTGAVTLSQATSNPVQIAVEVEVPSIWPDNAYAREGGYPGDAAATAEAARIVAQLAGQAIPIAAACPAGGTLPPLGAPSGYVNPVPGASLSRTDEGVDYTLGPAGFVAPADSQIVTIAGGWFRGGCIVGQILNGPYAGSEWFVGEGIAPAPGIVNGARVRAGTRVTTSISSPYNGIVGNIEAGWWKNGVPLAQSTGGYVEGQVTAAGAGWDDFVRALHGVAHPSNAIQSGSLAGLTNGQL